ncbi:penicillin-binding protein 2 [Patescibacteria group bacterium]|nr:MAG: penicillin-binding protein 2 [Patescibacteria group bacterium]
MRHARSFGSEGGARSAQLGVWRVSALLLGSLCFGGIVLIKLYNLQISDHQIYRTLADNQHQFSQQLDPERGQIYLGNGDDPYPLAVNQELQMAFVVPKEVTDGNLTANRLASILQLDTNEVLEKLSDPNDMYEVLKHRLTESEVTAVREAKLEGVYLISERFRRYPAGELAAHVIGFVGSDGERVSGRYGFEAFHEAELHGEFGSLSQERDSRGRWISIADRDLAEAKNGDSYILSIDYTVQYEVEKVLRETMEKHQADSGTIIVMEPKTGRLLALANAPTFNPNEFNKIEDIGVFLDPAINASYECGSVFKPITMAIGIEEGKVNAATTYVDTGVVHEAGYAIMNSDGKANGKQTMTDVLDKSLNTGAIFVEKQVGNQTFAEYVRRFGFGTKTGIELPAELSGSIANLSDARRTINFFTASFGQGIAVTPIQLVNAYAAMANGGVLMKPQLVERVIHSDGSIEEVAPEEIRRVVSYETAAQIGRMLRSVVVDGHGKRADVPGYLVGGKTGTAQVAKAGSKGYEDGLTIGSFAGYAPTDSPRFAVLVKIVNPKGVQWAESTAAPAFGKVMEKLFERYGVEPTEEIDVKKMNLSVEKENTEPVLPAVVPEKKDSKKKK